MKSDATSVETYLAQLPADRREALGVVRDLVRRIWPGIEEDMSYSMPTFHLDGHALCALASQKSFMALYIMPYDLLIAFKNELKLHDTGRSCIRFKRLSPELLDLLDRVLKYTGTRLPESKHLDKPGNIKSYVKP